MALAAATAVLGMLPADSASQGLPVRHPGGVGWYQDRQGELPAADRLSIRTRGDITVAGAAGDGIRYSARLRLRRPGDGPEWVQAALGKSGFKSQEREDGSLELALVEPDCAGCQILASIEIRVPAEIDRLDLRTRVGDIRVHGVSGSVGAYAYGGSVAMESIGAAADVAAAGSVRLVAVGGPVNCETSAGRIEVGRVAGPARLKTNIGSVRVDSVQGDLDAETGAGSIQVGRVSGAARLSTASGSIQVAEALGGLEAHAGAGDIRIRRADGALHLTTGAGNIAVALREGAGSRDSVLSTAVGTVVVWLPESIALTVEAAVQLVQGRQGIISDFPSIRVRRQPGLLGGADAAGMINGGGAVLRSGTGIGHIEIRRQQ